MSIRESIDRAPLSPYQILVVAICFLIVLVEGYDLLVMAYAASGVAQEWSLNGSQTGLLLSSSLAGMAIGSAFVAPLADKIGRRWQTIGCLVLIAASLSLSALSDGYVMLAVFRLLTGIGAGGLAAGLPVVVAEFAPQRRRATLITFYTIGLPLGGVVGGFVASLLLAQSGWRTVFVVGAILTTALLVLVLFALPESIDYLLARRPRNALSAINATLAKMRIATIDALPTVERSAEENVRSAIFKGKNGVRSILLGVAFFSMMASFYFAASWTPRLLEQSGFSAQEGISGGTLFNLGGAAASLVFGFIVIFAKVKWVTVVAFAGAAVSFVAMSSTLGNLTLTLIVAVAVGAFTQASGSGLYSLAPDCYPAPVRTTAVGWASAVGRMGAIVSPLIAGVLMDLSWTPSGVFALFGIPLAIGAICIAALRLPTLSEGARKPAPDEQPVSA